MAVQPLGFSNQGEYFAFCSPDGTLRIYDTATSALKQEYTPSSHLSATCSCLAWCPGKRGNVTPKKKKKRRKSLESSVGDGPDLISLGTTSGSILLYSILKGDLQTLLEKGHSDTVNGACWSQNGERLYSCSTDQHIIEWDLSTASVKQKWKADKGSVYSVCVCQNESYLLSAGRTIKMWDLRTHTAIKTFNGHSTEVFRLLMVPSITNGAESEGAPTGYFISAAANDRLIHVWHTQSKDKTALASFALPDEPVQLAISHPAKERTVQMAATTKTGDLVVYEHGLNGPMKKPIQPKSTVQVATEGGADTPKPIPIIAAQLYGDMTNSLLYAHGNFLRLTFEKLKVDALESHMCFVRKDPSKSSLQMEISVSKVKTPETSGDVTVLAPGHMAPVGPSRQDSNEKQGKKKRRKSASGEMSLDDRLNAISIDKPSERSGSEPPKADTLATLLTQGLQSNDKKILNNVLQNQSELIIRNTVRRLPIAVIVPLVLELSKRMHGHAQSGQALVKWLKCVLTIHTAYLMTFPELVGTLGKVYQMMESRTALFGRLSRLQGKLDLMLSQISSQTEEEEVVSAQPPMLVYQDDSSDDEAYGGDLVPDISESEDEWNEGMSGDDDEEEDGQNGDVGENDSDKESSSKDSEEEESMESDGGE